MQKYESYMCIIVASGSDAAALQTTAKLEGDHYIVNGTKVMLEHSLSVNQF